MEIGNRVKIISVRWPDKEMVGKVGKICKIISDNLYGVRINDYGIWFLMEDELEKVK